MKTNEEWIEEILQKKDSLVPKEHRNYSFNKLIKEAMLLAMKFKDEQARLEKIEMLDGIPCEEKNIGWIGYGNSLGQPFQKHRKAGRDKLINEIKEYKQEQLNKLNQ